ncbi:hypothetical protein [Azospirillum palustre]
MANVDDLKAKFDEQESHGQRVRPSGPSPDRLPRKVRSFRHFRPVALVATVLCAGMIGWFFLGSRGSACQDAVFAAGNELTDAALESLKQCTPDQMLLMARTRQSTNREEGLVLYELAAKKGSGSAARAIAEMLDPNGWVRATSSFSAPNATHALQWYRRAESLGEAGLRDRIEALKAAGAK